MPPRPRSWPLPSEDPATPGLPRSAAQFAQTMEQHVKDGLSPELALDLALNELVVAATDATHASAAALALTRGQQLVCRATTGEHAPDLGIPLNTYTGLSGACVRSRTAQRCVDTESDERVDPAASHRLGIRSILVVPILEGEDVVGIIEVFSRQPAAFSQSDEVQLRSFALECLNLRGLAAELTERPPHKLETPVSSRSPEVIPAAIATGTLVHRLEVGRSPTAASSRNSPEFSLSETIQPLFRSGIDIWTAVLTMMIVAIAVALILLIGVRTGWLGAASRPSVHDSAPHSAAAPDRQAEPASSSSATPKSAAASAPGLAARSSTPGSSGGLVIYDAGKVVFRATPKPANEPKSHAEGEKSTRVAPVVWLAAAAAEARLRNRVEPEYPADARAAHLSGDVTLEVLVRDDGSVESTRTLDGNPVLAEAAAAAVRNWRYEPYRLKHQPAAFQTEVTLKFSLPE